MVRDYKRKPVKKKRNPRRSGRQYVWSDHEIIRAAEQCDGNTVDMSAVLGCGYSTVTLRMRTVEKVKEAILAARESKQIHRVDKAEKNLDEALDAKNLDVSKFVVERQGKERGWAQRVEQRVGGDENAPPLIPGVTLDSLGLSDELVLKVAEALLAQGAHQALVGPPKAQLEYREQEKPTSSRGEGDTLPGVQEVGVSDE